MAKKKKLPENAPLPPPSSSGVRTPRHLSEPSIMSGANAGPRSSEHRLELILDEAAATAKPLTLRKEGT